MFLKLYFPKSAIRRLNPKKQVIFLTIRANCVFERSTSKKDGAATLMRGLRCDVVGTLRNMLSTPQAGEGARQETEGVRIRTGRGCGGVVVSLYNKGKKKKNKYTTKKLYKNLAI